MNIFIDVLMGAVGLFAIFIAIDIARIWRQIGKD
jgi:hypothetical protein